MLTESCDEFDFLIDQIGCGKRARSPDAAAMNYRFIEKKKRKHVTATRKRRRNSGSDSSRSVDRGKKRKLVSASRKRRRGSVSSHSGGDDTLRSEGSRKKRKFLTPRSKKPVPPTSSAVKRRRNSGSDSSRSEGHGKRQRRLLTSAGPSNEPVSSAATKRRRISGSDSSRSDGHGKRRRILTSARTSKKLVSTTAAAKRRRNSGSDTSRQEDSGKRRRLLTSAGPSKKPVSTTAAAKRRRNSGSDSSRSEGHGKRRRTLPGSTTTSVTAAAARKRHRGSVSDSSRPNKKRKFILARRTEKSNSKRKRLDSLSTDSAANRNKRQRRISVSSSSDDDDRLPLALRKKKRKRVSIPDDLHSSSERNKRPRRISLSSSGSDAQISLVFSGDENDISDSQSIVLSIDSDDDTEANLRNKRKKRLRMSSDEDDDDDRSKRQRVLSESQGSESEGEEIIQSEDDNEVPLYYESDEVDEDDTFSLMLRYLQLKKIGQRSRFNSDMMIHEYLLTTCDSTVALQNINLVEIMATFGELVERAVYNLHCLDEDRLQVNVTAGSNSYISSACVESVHFDISLILAAVEKASQSGNLFNLLDKVRVDIKHFSSRHISKGNAGRSKFQEISNHLYCSRRRCIIEITNFDDNMCLGRAIVVALARHNLDNAENDDPEKKRKYRKHYECVRRSFRGKGKQYKLARSLFRQVGISLFEKTSFSDVTKIENHLGIYVKIVARDLFNKFSYDGMKINPRENDEQLPVLYLYRVLNVDGSYHYNVIVNIATFFESKFFCVHCNVSYHRLEQHRCQFAQHWCYSCYKPFCKSDSNFVSPPCNFCNINFRNVACKQRHEQFASCEKFFFCTMCFENVKRSIKPDGSYQTNLELSLVHKCSTKCNLCKEERDPLHRCYIQKRTFKPISDKYLFLDFEAHQASNEHVPCFCHLKWREPRSKAEVDSLGYGEDPFVWCEQSFGLSENVRDDVGDFIFSTTFKGYTIIAHNMRGYDGCFLLRYLVEHGIKPDITCNGLQFLSMYVKGYQIRVIDSLNFLPMPLSAFPKTFGLSSGEKGHFPVLFIDPVNFDYIGEMPAEKYYAIDSLNVSKYKDFKQWYDEYNNSDYIFNFRNEIVKYCIQDVNVLAEGCWSFRKLILGITHGECDPFQYLTLAQLCSEVYKVQFMPENSIAAVPPMGYVDTQHYSSVSLEWLFYLNRIEHKNIIHIGNSPTGEVNFVGNIRVDGFDKSNNTVYEFYGCFYHGCTRCYSTSMRKIHPLYQVTFDTVYERTMDREARLRIMGFNVASMWECEWNDFKDKNDHVKFFVQKNYHSFKPLNPHDSFYGGRVEVFKMLVDDHKTKMNYEDVNSLYPFVNSSCRYPKGHPEILFSDFKPFDSLPDRVFGFIYCKILPPFSLYIPVLPMRYGKPSKLLFPLCNLCAENQLTSVCNHSIEERCIIGTWFSEEIKLALQNGYKILDVFSVYHFKQSGTDLFDSYIKTFYKLKILASGKPDSCVDDESLQKYVDAMLKCEGIDLRGEVFELNTGLRLVAKLMLNSLWGKFGSKKIHSSIDFCTSIQDLFIFFNDSGLTVTNVVDVAENMVYAVHEKKSVDYLSLNNVNNVYIASCTTAHARIILYKYLSKVDSRAVYCDTDSIIYSCDNVNLPTGEFLGELKSELPAGTYIIQFCSAAPKIYAYIVGDILPNGDYVMFDSSATGYLKMKGFRINTHTQSAFQFENMKRIVETVGKNFSDDQFVNILSAKDRRVAHKQKRDEVFNEVHSKKPDDVSTFVDSECISIYNPNIIKRTNRWKLIKDSEQKIFMSNYDKRIVNAQTFDTIPFGYRL